MHFIVGLRSLLPEKKDYIYSEEMTVLTTQVTDRVIDSSSIRKSVIAPECGAVVEFYGLVRNHDAGKSVEKLEYEGHETALAIINEITAEVDRQYPQVRFAVSHRLGSLLIGDLAFYVVAASAHREAAFKVCQFLVEEVKEKIPVWKNQIFVDGSNEWVNSA